MSFDDNMYDDGFTDAQDYMDYLMNEANKSYEADFYYNYQNNFEDEEEFEDEEID